METTSERTLTSVEAINIATSEDSYESGNESASSDTSYSAGMHTSGDDTDGECAPVQEVDRIMKTLKTRGVQPVEEKLGGVLTKEETSPSTELRVVATHTMAGLEVGITSNKSKRVHYSEDSDCGLFSDGSHEMEDEDNVQEEELEEKNQEVIPELETTNLTTDTEDEEESGDDSCVDFPHLTTDELKYMHVANELASTDSPIEDLKPLPQRFQEGCVGEKKKTSGISLMYVDDIIYDWK